MAMDKYAKLDLLIRTAFRDFWVGKNSTAKQKMLILPAFDVPRFGAVDIYLHPKAGTTLGLILRCDYVAAYKHAVGQLVGGLAHYHAMTERQVREGVRTVKASPEAKEIKQGKIDALKISKRLQQDRKAGKLTIALATDLPEVPQQAAELKANFFPIAAILKSGLVAPVGKKKLCQDVLFFAVQGTTDPPEVKVLADAIKPLLKAAAAS